MTPSSELPTQPIFIWHYPTHCTFLLLTGLWRNVRCLDVSKICRHMTKTSTNADQHWNSTETIKNTVLLQRLKCLALNITLPVTEFGIKVLNLLRLHKAENPQWNNFTLYWVHWISQSSNICLRMYHIHGQLELNAGYNPTKNEKCTLNAGPGKSNVNFEKCMLNDGLGKSNVNFEKCMLNDGLGKSNVNFEKCMLNDGPGKSPC